MTNLRARWAVGLMSGTSMDGIDAALVRISGPLARPRVHLHSFISLAYPPATRAALLRIAGGEPVASEEFSRLNFVLGGLFAGAAAAVCRKGRIPLRRLAVIGSHGQTVFHQGRLRPGRGSKVRLRIGSTLQIGEPAVIAEQTGTTVVADFRAADVAAGGHGAPLVPMVDYLLLRNPKLGSIALNLGGIANITAIPAGASIDDIRGFDTGPANMVIDGLVRHFTRGAEQYDAGGGWARRGEVIEPLLAKILRMEFFRCRPPKSAGREQFGSGFLTRFFLKRRARPEDLLRTAIELTAQSVAQAISRFVYRRGAFHRLIVSGGGAHNLLLMERLGALLSGLALETSDAFGMPVDAKEAMAFALLADRTLHGLPGNIPAVTGARHRAVLGKIVRPPLQLGKTEILFC